MAEDSSEIVKEQSESVAAANLKVMGDMPAYYAGLGYQQGLDAAVGWRTINQAIVGKVEKDVAPLSADSVPIMFPCSSSRAK